MNVRALSVIAVLAGLTGCDKLPFVGKAPEEAPPTPEPAGAVQPEAAADPAAAEAAQAAAEAASPPPPPRPGPPSVSQRAAAPAIGTEEPWSPTFSGTVNPGMSLDDVISVWGEPVVERNHGNWTFLYYRNGCERRCGTYDVVLFEGGQVVDAIVRAPGHVYSGVSSSPPGREPIANVVNFGISGGAP